MIHARETSAYAYKVTRPAWSSTEPDSPSSVGFASRDTLFFTARCTQLACGTFAFHSVLYIYDGLGAFSHGLFQGTPIGMRMVDETTFKRWFLHRIRAHMGVG